MIFVSTILTGTYLVKQPRLSGMWYLLAWLNDRSSRAPVTALPCSKTPVFCGKPSMSQNSRKSPVDIKLGGF